MTLRKDHNHCEKSNLYQVILTMKKNLARAKNKVNIAELKRLKKRDIKMLKELGEEHLEV